MMRMTWMVLTALLVLAGPAQAEDPASAEDPAADTPECGACAARKSGMRRIYEARKARECAEALAEGVQKDGCPRQAPAATPQE